MSDIAYYVKIRGRTIGPFTADRLKQMAQQGQLSRVNMISPDGHQWQRAGDLPQLFDNSGGQRNFAANSAALQVAAEPKVETKDPASQQARAEWHYAIGTDQHGPVTFGQLRGLIQNGSVGANDLVWKDGMADWEPILTVPELAASVPQRNYSARQRDRSMKKKGDESVIDLAETRRVVRAGNSWVFFICIATYVLAGLVFIGSIAGIIMGARLQSGMIVAQAVTNSLVGGILVTGAIFLNRYSSLAGRFVANSRIDDLNDGLRWLGRFWLFAGIIIIFTLTISLVSLIYLIAIDADLSTYSPY